MHIVPENMNVDARYLEHFNKISFLLFN